ncbi:hypothetical protein IMY05_004G0150000 [Salix suchowensis]|nr:hypothetical protein IMY05_004G0150000 [Salix suchowensis]
MKSRTKQTLVQIRKCKLTFPCFISLSTRTNTHCKNSSCLVSCPLSEAGQAWETNLRSQKEKLCLHWHQTGQRFS